MKKITNKHFKLEDKIYNSSTDVIVGDWDYFHKYLKKQDIELDIANKDWIAETGEIRNDDGTLKEYYIRIPVIDWTSENYGTIIHELSHLTFNVLDSVSVKFGAENQEPYTYLLEMFLKDFLRKAMKL
jgi:hypothetical protein